MSGGEGGGGGRKKIVSMTAHVSSQRPDTPQAYFAQFSQTKHLDRPVTNKVIRFQSTDNFGERVAIRTDFPRDIPAVKLKKRAKCCHIRGHWSTVVTSLRELACHMGSHSFTCHPTEAAFQPQPQPKLVLGLSTPDG